MFGILTILCFSDESNKEESAEILLNQAKEKLKQLNNNKTDVIVAEDFTEFELKRHK